MILSQSEYYTIYRQNNTISFDAVVLFNIKFYDIYAT
jgi:hypothetical protein